MTPSTPRPGFSTAVSSSTGASTSPPASTPRIAAFTAVALLAVSLPAIAAQPALARGQPPAGDLVEAAIRHEHAEGTARDYAAAHALYCEAARQGSADALLRMGWMYANGRGVPHSDATAHALFARAARLGSETAGRLAGMIRPAPGVAPTAPPCLQATGVRAIEAALAAAPSPAHRKLLQAIVAQARQHKVDPRLVLAVIRTESNFDPGARSPKNALGLMQLIPETAERFAVADLLDPVQNVGGGVRYLRWLLSYFRGNVNLTLAAYNAGEGAVDRYGGVPPFAETVAYVARIRALYPHDRHPYDPRVAKASPVVAAGAGPTAAAAPSTGSVRRSTY